MKFVLANIQFYNFECQMYFVVSLLEFENLQCMNFKIEYRTLVNVGY
jgi:hypothetical protein